MPHTYIQSIAIDRERELIYCLCFAPEKLVAYDVANGAVTDYGLVASGCGGMAQGEYICLDDRGCVWATWQVTRAWQSSSGVDMPRLCKIDPEQGRVVYYRNGLPRPDGAYGTVQAEGLFNLGDGTLYACENDNPRRSGYLWEIRL